MSEASPQTMTVDEFLVWAEGRPGRHELIDGRPSALRQQTIGHGRMKAAAAWALWQAAERLPTPHEAFGDGTTVAVDRLSAFQPYALLRCGPKLSRDTIIVPDPVAVVELVLFGVPRGHDALGKMAGYFALPSLEHYLLIDGDHRIVTHCRRHGTGVAVCFHREGPLRLDPPGLDLDVADLLGPAEDETSPA